MPTKPIKSAKRGAFFTYCLLILQQWFSPSQASTNLLMQRICLLMLLVLIIQTSKLWWFMPPQMSVDDALKHVLNIGAHICVFLCAYYLAPSQHFLLARTLLIAGFCHFIIVACYIWQANIALHYYLLLSMFITCYLFQANEQTLRKKWVLAQLLGFILASLLLSDISSQTRYPVVWLLQLKTINELVFAVSCAVCALFITNLTSTNWSNIKSIKQAQRSLIHRLVPAQFVSSLLHKTNKENPICQHRELAVLFLDICDFTQFANNTAHSQKQSWQIIYALFARFDAAIAHLDAKRVKVNGDQYIVVIGLHTPPEQTNVMVKQALDMAKLLTNISEFKLKQGLALGKVTYGIFDANHPYFDIWGPTVILAARLEQISPENGLIINHRLYQFAQNIYPSKYFTRKNKLIKGMGYQNVYQVSLKNSSDESISLTN